MASARFRELERRVAKLRKRFLPATFSPTGDYSEEELDRTRGFRLLVHAEIEAFLEDRCKSVANVRLQQFRASDHLSYTLLNLVSFNLIQSELNEADFKSLFAANKKHCHDAATKATTTYHWMITKNNGIREKDFLRMVLPLGVKPIDIDPAWLSTLDTLGVSRGEVAHTSIKAQKQINPQDELNIAETVMKGLEKLDTILSKLR